MCSMFDALPTDLRTFRTSYGKTQVEMAEAMGLTLRGYQDIEGGRNPVRAIHVKAALFAALVFSDGNGGRDNLPLDLGELVRRVYECVPDNRRV